MSYDDNNSNRWADDNSYRQAGSYGPGGSYERSGHSYMDAGDWLMSTARRNPEAILVLAAGLALLMRGGSRSRRAYPVEENRRASMDVYREGEYEEEGRALRSPIRAVRSRLSGVAETAGEYASGVTERVYETAADVTGRVYETAGSYASAVSEYADAGRRRLSRQASRAGRQAYRMGNQAGEMLHEQPLAVAALGLAAGAAVAAFLPRVEMEERALRPARDALADAAGRAVESVKEAATDAGRRLQDRAADLGAAALKDAARGAVQSFASGASGSSDQPTTRVGGSGPSAGGGGQ
jgi:hypothetical protein